MERDSICKLIVSKKKRLSLLQTEMEMTPAEYRHKAVKKNKQGGDAVNFSMPDVLLLR